MFESSKKKDVDCDGDGVRRSLKLCVWTELCFVNLSVFYETL